jgi:hypothetical protein
MFIRRARFPSEDYRAGVAGATACAASQNRLRHPACTSFGRMRGLAISSRASQNAAALLFEASDVDVR